MRPRLRKRSNLPRRAWAMGLAACAHLLALVGMGWRIPKLAGPSPAEEHSPAMEVTLVRPQTPRRLQAAPTASRPAPSTPPAPPPASSRVLITPAPGAPALSAPLQSPPAPAPEAVPDGQRLREALRGALGCTDPQGYRLTREERAACDQRLAAAGPAPLQRPFSAEELAQFDAENKYDPVLVRKPHNGCLPRVADRPAATTTGGPPPPTRSGATTAFGIGCARSF